MADPLEMRGECGNEGGGGHLLFHDEDDFLVVLELAEGSGVNGMNGG
jgi:hypothetical protein